MKRCLYCKKEIITIVKTKYKGKIYTYKYPAKKSNKFCSTECYHSYVKGKKLTGKALDNAQLSIKKALDARMNNPVVRKKWIAKMKKINVGSKNWKWIEDRSKVVNQDERNSEKYKEWRKKVIERDRYKCKINNKDCGGKIEVHHILSWRDYPELRYNVTNGITLCKNHHPRKRIDEKRLITFFQKLIK